MTKEQFWLALDKHWIAGEMDQFWELWYDNPEYVQDRLSEIDRELENPNSALRKQSDAWWADLRPRLVEAFGEDWVKEHCKD